ncbi:hypothetical protein TanjilG_30049 [Lupinus angustifolius]|uniref:FHA domain-containing protein n=1 Tax=Lupinus angustifolius TaxID=3871 RepID=A0A4P1R6B5_LUPAN|nr:PREDICTED: uncharacterized protein LOC109358534 [Lupinus angustifolius]OIW03773.1 hypothetical protein TanjilG_30049 [Lupinus angustifolius]
MMELLQVQAEGEDGSKFAFTLRSDNGEEGKSFFGRDHGFNTNDRTVSRRHVLFQFNSESESRVSFQVIGKNPIWVLSTNNDGTLRIFRKFEKGQLQFGDRFCLSGKVPIWFNLKKIELQEGTENDDEIDVSGIDVVKEFGFLLMGQEFDRYPKSMIRNVKNWQWFLEEPLKDSDNEEDYGKERREMKRKRKNGKDNVEDDEWTGESEDDKDIVAKVRKGKRPGYSTRSKDCKGPNRGTKGSINSKPKKATSVNETVEEEEEDDDDETLGGFIVDDADDQEEEKFDEEEEFEDDDDVDGVED